MAAKANTLESVVAASNCANVMARLSLAFTFLKGKLFHIQQILEWTFTVNVIVAYEFLSLQTELARISKNCA